MASVKDLKSSILDLVGLQPEKHNLTVNDGEYERTKAYNQYDLHHDQAHEQIFGALKNHIESVNKDTCDAGDENSFFVCDLGEIQRLYRYWCEKLPRVTPFYAVKSNPNPQVLKTLCELNANFDCASKSEIEKVLRLGAEPSRIIYANPCKASSFIRFAKQKNVRKSTFDNVEELHKIKRFHPESELLLRIATDDSTAQCRLSTKYGCSMEEVGTLLAKVEELGLNLVGVSFHVGSGASDFGSFEKAIRDARIVFDMATKKFGMEELHILDIGGGFQLESFEESSRVINAALEQYFPVSSEVEVIAEPGRYFAATAFTLACHVIAKNSHGKGDSMLYINDGVYGNMNCILFDHQTPIPRVLFHNSTFHYMVLETSSPILTQNCPNRVSIWGPTCDGLDCITDKYYMKYDLVVGDWLYFPNLGAYTSSAATPFNGFEQAVDIIYINSENL